MIKFFRRIRKKLLSENKFSKYILYAIGEIILVVIGILIALQIGNWNNIRRLSDNRILLLENIKADYTSNQKRLQEALKNSNEINQNTIYFMALLSKDTKYIPRDTLRKYSSRFISITRFSPLNSSYLTAQSTGEIGLIKDKNLLELFIEFQEASNWLNFHVQLSGDLVYSGNIWEMRKKLGSLNVIFSDTSDPFPGNFNKSDSELNSFFREKETYATIESMYWINRNVLRSIHLMLEVNEKILIKIDELLKT